MRTPKRPAIPCTGCFSVRNLGLAVVALCATAFSPVLAAKDPPRPDFSGVWTWFGSGPGRADASWPKDPPFTKEAQEKVAAYRALVAPTGDTPGGHCVGTGMPGSMLGSGGYPMEIIQRPEQITVIYEAHTEIRRIYIGAPPVDPADQVPSRNGYSTGKWDGDTLVVETGFLKEAVDQAAAHSEEAKIVERYRLAKGEKDERVLTAELTLTDPRFYTRPVTVTKKWRPLEKGRMMLYECSEPEWEDHLEALRKAAAK
jgi:hypothetical protein